MKLSGFFSAILLLLFLQSISKNQIYASKPDQKLELESAKQNPSTELQALKTDSKVGDEIEGVLYFEAKPTSDGRTSYILWMSCEGYLPFVVNPPADKFNQPLMSEQLIKNLGIKTKELPAALPVKMKKTSITEDYNNAGNLGALQDGKYCLQASDIQATGTFSEKELETLEACRKDFKERYMITEEAAQIFTSDLLEKSDDVKGEDKKAKLNDTAKLEKAMKALASNPEILVVKRIHAIPMLTRDDKTKTLLIIFSDHVELGIQKWKLSCGYCPAGTTSIFNGSFVAAKYHLGADGEPAKIEVFGPKEALKPVFGESK